MLLGQGDSAVKYSYVLALILIVQVISARASEPCSVIHGRLHYYGGDGNLRLWHIGTHHEFEPADQDSWNRAFGWLTQGIWKDDSKNYASPESNLMLYGDFTVCPAEPLHKGAVQAAWILKVTNKHYVRIDP